MRRSHFSFHELEQGNGGQDYLQGELHCREWQGQLGQVHVHLQFCGGQARHHHSPVHGGGPADHQREAGGPRRARSRENFSWMKAPSVGWLCWLEESPAALLHRHPSRTASLRLSHTTRDSSGNDDAGERAAALPQRQRQGGSSAST